MQSMIAVYGNYFVTTVQEPQITFDINRKEIIKSTILD